MFDERACEITSQPRPRYQNILIPAIRKSRVTRRAGYSSGSRSDNNNIEILWRFTCHDFLAMHPASLYTLPRVGASGNHLHREKTQTLSTSFRVRTIREGSSHLKKNNRISYWECNRSMNPRHAHRYASKSMVKTFFDDYVTYPSSGTEYPSTRSIHLLCIISTFVSST